jgi:ribonuclease-3
LSFDLKRVQKKLNIIFNDPQLLEQALTHRSIGNSNNERLEFLGDSILGFSIADKVYEKFPDADEGVMSRLRANLVNKHSLAELAEQLDLGEELILGPGELKSGGRNRKSILSDAVEAIIGAIYKDSDFETSCSWVVSHFSVKLDGLSTEAAIKDPKTRLQELLQSRNEKVPTYSVISTTGLDHNQLFTVECYTNLLNSPLTASASSRKKAEQKAAEKVLEALDEK